MNFKQFKIKEFITKTLESKKITQMTKIQESSLPLLLNNKSLIITSPTGSGKTYCYIIPILNKLDNSSSTQAIIILPTKELARQVYSKVLDFTTFNNDLTTYLLIGGNNFDLDKNKIKNKHPNVIVGTPDKILELLKSKTIDSNKIKTLVIDESDMLIRFRFYSKN